MAEKGKASAVTPRRRRPHWAAGEEKSVRSEASPEDRYHSRTIERALDVLEAFESNSSALSLKEVSAITEQPEASLYRVLTTLQKRAYLLQNRDGTYQLARKVLYGRVLDKAETLRTLARSTLEELGRRFDETASLSYLFTHYIQVIDTVETFHSIRVTNRVGRIIPPHCSAMGKCILAHQTDAVCDLLLESYGLVRRTEYSICDRHLLREELMRVREQGYACDREESMLGGICFAAPIFDHHNHVIGAISVSTPKQRLDADREKSIKEAVQEAAARIAQMPQNLSSQEQLSNQFSVFAKNDI